jgi:hypothetical protein
LERQGNVRYRDLGPSSLEQIGWEGSSRSPLPLARRSGPAARLGGRQCASRNLRAPPTGRLLSGHSVEDDRPDQLADLRAKCLVLCRYQRAERVTGQLGLRDGGLDAPGRMCEAALLASHHGSGLDGKVHVGLHWLVGEGSIRESDDGGSLPVRMSRPGAVIRREAAAKRRAKLRWARLASRDDRTQRLTDRVVGRRQERADETAGQSRLSDSVSFAVRRQGRLAAIVATHHGNSLGW